MTRAPRLDVTFRGNVARGRHGWLRLTPSYSAALVESLLVDAPPDTRVLDPFCGTGTTALVCASRGLACDTTDINPFLVWLAQVKTAAYAPELPAALGALTRTVRRAVRATRRDAPWLPDLHRIEAWWPPRTLQALGRAHAAIEAAEGAVRDLGRVAFGRLLQASAHVGTHHPSPTFRPRPDDPDDPAALLAVWDEAVAGIEGALAPNPPGTPRVLLADARTLALPPGATYDRVVTSPPYPNRMSYVRELRPYLYWFGHLVDRRGAGELDWRAIGGTWGVATSRLTRWTPDPGRSIPWAPFAATCAAIEAQSPLLARYVHRYLDDFQRHLAALGPHLAPGATVHYVVGNAAFYGVPVPIELFVALFEAAGFTAVAADPLRKRHSKTGLYEYVVRGLAPG